MGQIKLTKLTQPRLLLLMVLGGGVAVLIGRWQDRDPTKPPVSAAQQPPSGGPQAAVGQLEEAGAESSEAAQPTSQPTDRQRRAARLRTALKAGRMAQVGDDPELAAIVKMARDERWPEAERRLQELLGEQPDHHEALVEMGLLQLRQRHDPQAARPYFKQALQLEPEDELLVRQYLQTFDAVDELEQGVAALQEFRQRYGSSAAIDETLGDMLLLRDEPQAAIELLEAARARQQSRADAPDIRLGQQLARAYLDAGRVDDGIFLLRELIARTEHPLPLKRLKLKLAAAYLQSGQRAAAIAVFDEMAREFPADELISKIRRDIRTGRL